MDPYQPTGENNKTEQENQLNLLFSNFNGWPSDKDNKAKRLEINRINK